MCTSERHKEVRPELPEKDLALDDPLRFIPTDYRPMVHRYDDKLCPKCGSPCSEDELATYNGHKSHFIKRDGSIPSARIERTSLLMQPDIKYILGCPKAPSLTVFETPTQEPALD